MKPLRLGLGLLTGAIAIIVLPAFSSASFHPTPSAATEPTATGQPSPSVQPTPAAPLASESPHRLTINVSVAEPADLKVKAGATVKTGDLIADRGRERSRLEAQKQQLTLALSRLKSAHITQPLPPAATPAIAQLPAPSYLEEQAGIDRAQVTVTQMEQTISLKQQEIAYLQSLQNLDPLVLEHEQAQLASLSQQHTAAVRDYQLAVGKLATAKEANAYQHYQHSIDLAQRTESYNRDRLEYQQQFAAYEQRLRDRDYQVSQSQLKLDEVNTAIATLATVKAPYAGQIRRIKWLGQSPDGSLSVAITLLLDNRSAAPLPGEQTGVHQRAQRNSDRPEQ